MRQLTAFMRKEWLESVRTGKVTILLLLFIGFGILNPAIAKLTPRLLTLMSESLSETGLSVSAVKVDALTSWAQFYKNAPLGLIVFLLVFSGTLTNEYLKGTLINLVTKGLRRWKIIASKGIVLAAFWTAGYWLCYVVTYGYNAYFWDNGAAAHLFFSAFCFYALGIWLISLILAMSAFFGSGSGVMLGVGGSFLIVYLLGLLPRIAEYLPAYLLNASNLTTGNGQPADYAAAIAVTSVWIVLNVVLAVLRFNRKLL
ncbi:ABC transporter permease subunit [Saccharibacillus alkalitolerans]|uniref:ABC transporter permease subunit n=1 Tax=Saccharibacillus alkalitolerans TaxID=2705290 RepID=A0ABX0F897_9BACL|nr:ABC transporter permease subunit [Saccharibacillus alkalitolerans]NGZ77087.1 ABC transporter permease subunit [Saccharibacillus alkalitolerans]